MSKKDKSRIIKNFFKTYVRSDVNTKKISRFLSDMSSYVHKCPIDPMLKQKKIEKIYKLQSKLNKLKDINVNVHFIAHLWLDLCCKNLILENGYNSIDETLKKLNIKITLDTSVKLDNDLETFFNNNSKLFLTKLLIPLNCSFRAIF